MPDIVITEFKDAPGVACPADRYAVVDPVGRSATAGAVIAVLEEGC